MWLEYWFDTTHHTRLSVTRPRFENPTTPAALLEIRYPNKPSRGTEATTLHPPFHSSMEFGAESQG